MKLDRLIKIASSGYDDGCVEMYYLEPDGKHGDLLAKFIAVELKETFRENASDVDQFDRAIGTLSKAKRDLEDVVEVLLENRRCKTKGVDIQKQM